MSKFRVTNTMYRKEKVLHQWHKENVTYLGLFVALISFFRKKEFGFYIERMVD